MPACVTGLIVSAVLCVWCNNQLYETDVEKNIRKKMPSHVVELEPSLSRWVSIGNLQHLPVCHIPADYIRTFTWDKKLEMVVKSAGILGGQGVSFTPNTCTH